MDLFRISLFVIREMRCRRARDRRDITVLSKPAEFVVKDFMFMPTPLTIKAGSTVTWTNTDDEPHTAVSDMGLFKSGGMDTNDSFSFKFDKPGTYHYTCTIHPRMVGVIVVQ
jgi:plastocyanin